VPIFLQEEHGCRGLCAASGDASHRGYSLINSGGCWQRCRFFQRAIICSC